MAERPLRQRRGMVDDVMDRLKARREAQGVSLHALAKRIQMDRRTIKRWETGTHEPLFGHIVKYARAVGCDVELRL